MVDPTFLTLEEVLLIHESMIMLYGGSHGVRDHNLLESALEMPRSGFGGTYFHETIFDMAAAYLFHLAKNHPFVDGNKRIGLGCADLFLAMNNHELQLSEDEAFNLAYRVATGVLTKVEIAKILEEHSAPAEG